MWTGRCSTPTGPCGPGRRRRWPGRRGRASGRSSARAGVIAAPGRSPSNSAWTPRWCATRGPSSRTRPTIARSGAPTSTPSWPPTSSQLFRTQDQPSVVFTDRDPDDFDLIVPAFPTGRESFDDYVAKNREHAEIDPDGRRRTDPFRSALATTSRCSTSARSGHSPRCSRSSERPSTGLRPCPDVRAPHLALPRDHVRDLAHRCQQVDGRPPPGRALGHRRRARSAPWGMTPMTSP